MTEQMPINQQATEQRLVEELTGSAPPVEEHAEPDLVRPGDPEATFDEEQQPD